LLAGLIDRPDRQATSPPRTAHRVIQPGHRGDVLAGLRPRLDPHKTPAQQLQQLSPLVTY
jgi:hypothetical protein